MKLVVLSVIAGLFVFFTLRSSGLGGAGDIPRVSADQARKLLSENKAILVDVREKGEIEAGMLKVPFGFRFPAFRPGMPRL